MKIGPKYKIARRLGAPIFEKTQTVKYTLSLSRKERSGKVPMRPKSEFGQALLEKQKARFTYGLSERQFRGYVDKALHAVNPAQKLFFLLESRLDNVLFRAGLAKTRASARQISSHGHALVNGRRVTVPSILLSVGDKVGLRVASANSILFAEATERMKAQVAPAWLLVDPEVREASVVGEPVYERGSQVFDLAVVIEFYNR
ncbi:MAG: 30S ribosomal protein S4 [Candidatus Zambryskibacteria bacterium]|nr:30S ribosomal protein S4 [Candidatus Zambryskibacteria bacterium]